MINLNKINKQAGVTLIETIIYLALYGLIMSGVVVSVYALFESSSKNQTKAMVQEEGTFLLGKIDWALTGASAVNVSITGEQLYINRNDIPGSENPLTFDSSGGNISLSRGTALSQRLNNTNITITNPVFTHAVASGDGIVPESVRTSLTLTSFTLNGFSYSQEFSSIKYLRR